MLDEWILDDTQLLIVEQNQARKTETFIGALDLDEQARTAIGNGKVDAALALAKQAAHAFMASGVPEVAAKTLTEIGALLNGQGYAKAAVNVLTAADHILVQTNDTAWRAVVFQLLGEANQANNSTQKAISDFKLALPAARLSGLPLVELSVLTSLASLTPSRDDESRLMYYRDFLDSAFTSATRSRLWSQTINLHKKWAVEIIPLEFRKTEPSLRGPSDFKKIESSIRVRMLKPLGNSWAVLPRQESIVRRIGHASEWESVLDVFSARLLERLMILLAEKLLLISQADIRLNVFAQRTDTVQEFALSLKGALSKALIDELKLWSKTEDEIRHCMPDFRHRRWR